MKGTHLTLNDRKAIQEGLEEGLSRAAIARKINKNASTVSKEVKLHRKYRRANYYGRNVSYFCKHRGEYKYCYGCKKECKNYEVRDCLRRDRKIGVCNKCPDLKRCSLEKYFYIATRANEEYLYTLSDSRQGVNLTSGEMITMAQTIAPLLRKGQSVYQILKNHPEFDITPKTLYTYIETGIFKDYGIDNFSLRRKVSMRPRKKLKARKSPANYEGRKYSDYLTFVAEHPTTTTTEMDTVYNDPEGPYIQTFIFQNTGFMIGFLHTEKTSASMAATLDVLQDKLGEDYYRLFSLLLTDRGSEFEKHRLFENNYDTGELRTNIFYCDPQAASQKPHVENNHLFVRNIIPNGKSLKGLTQADLDLVFSHINSVPRKVLNGRTPYEVFDFFYGAEIARKLNIERIDKDAVTLMPYLLNVE